MNSDGLELECGHVAIINLFETFKHLHKHFHTTNVKKSCVRIKKKNIGPTCMLAARFFAITLQKAIAILLLEKFEFLF